jgi:AraC family transcriptional regulator of adaptative response/methylated-DNA-[protein]-cysteine methyltransferase
MKSNHGLLGGRDFERICKALRFIESHWREQPSLLQMARACGLSSAHFNRLFHAWAGITPKSYLQWVTGAVAKAGLRDKASLLDTALTVGLSGPGRLHDLIIKLDAMSPAEYAAQGAGLRIEYGVAPSPFGWMLVGRTARGVCHLSFESVPDSDMARRQLMELWPSSTIIWKPEVATTLASQLWNGAARPEKLALLVRGTQFQLKVWQALLALPVGTHSSYAELGREIGAPSAARAVGGAVGANPVAWLIPCHRVLRSGGELGGYHWGVDRKRAILAWEQVRGA